MHLLITTNSSWNVYNFRSSLLHHFVSQKYKVTVLAPVDDSIDHLEKVGCKIIPLDMSVKGINPYDDLKLLWQLTRIFEQQKPDIILSYTIKNNIFGAIAAKSLGILFIPNVTGLGTAFLSGRMLRLLVQKLYQLAFKNLPVIFFQNADDFELFVNQGIVRPDQARVLPGSGVDLTRFLAADNLPSETTTTFLMIARLLRDKGLIEFVNAARQIKTLRPETKFQLLGSIDAKNRTAVDVKTLQSWVTEGIIDYLGATPDVRQYIAAASCVVLPSYREGAPRALLEAAAMGRPVITTDVPGCRSVVVNNRTGFLCEPRSVDSLAASMLRFLDLSHTERVIMGRRARTKMEREFDEKFVIDAYLQVIKELVNSRNI